MKKIAISLGLTLLILIVAITLDGRNIAQEYSTSTKKELPIETNDQGAYIIDAVSMADHPFSYIDLNTLQIVDTELQRNKKMLEIADAAEAWVAKEIQDGARWDNSAILLETNKDDVLLDLPVEVIIQGIVMDSNQSAKVVVCIQYAKPSKKNDEGKAEFLESGIRALEHDKILMLETKTAYSYIKNGKRFFSFSMN